MSRKRPAQLALPLLERPKRGGARLGAGRKNLSRTRAHLRRPVLNPRHPVHVTLKLAAGVPSLRNKERFRSLRLAVRAARRRDLRIIQFAILSNHIHLIVEPNRETLFRELQSLTVSLARRINARLARRGAVFHGRYHLHVLKTPTETRRALAYGLTNDAKHRGGSQVRLDPFTSAPAFRDWRKLFRKAAPRLEPTTLSDLYIEMWHAEILSPPRSWLLRSGWMRATG